MSSTYGLAESDLTPNPISATLWLQLVDDDNDGTADVSAADLITAAESRFGGWLGGTMTDAANIAVAKPFVVLVAVYLAHFHRAQNADYKVPQEVKDGFAEAQAWAKKEGQRLLASEGSVSPPGSGGVEYDADDATHTLTQLDAL